MFFIKSTLEKELRKLLSVEQVIYYSEKHFKLKNGSLVNFVDFKIKNRNCNMYLIYSEYGIGLYLKIGFKKYQIVKLFNDPTNLFNKLNNLIIDNFQEMTQTQTINGV